jgi:uncharacterized protein YoxC
LFADDDTVMLCGAKAKIKNGDRMLLTVSVTVIAACFLILIFFLSPLILQFYRLSCELKKLTEFIRIQIEPITRDLTDILCQTKDILQSLHREVNQIEEGVSAVRDIAVRLKELQKQVQQRVETPLIELAALIGSMIKGFQSIIKFFHP